MTQPVVANAPTKEQAVSRVRLQIHRFETSGFGAVSLISFSVKNGNPFPIRDLTVQCFTYGSSDTPINVNKRVLYERIPTNDVIMVREFNMGFIDNQSKKTSCSITDFNV